MPDETVSHDVELTIERMRDGSVALILHDKAPTRIILDRDDAVALWVDLGEALGGVVRVTGTTH